MVKFGVELNERVWLLENILEFVEDVRLVVVVNGIVLLLDDILVCEVEKLIVLIGVNDLLLENIFEFYEVVRLVFEFWDWVWLLVDNLKF